MDTKEIIDQFVDDVLDGNNLAAKEAFQNAISIKVSDAIEQKKVEVAQSVYNDDATSDNTEQEEDTEE
jgi:hypothetical protein